MILQADKLTLQYGQKIIADKLNFKVDKSEIISIIGPNGSGKSLGRLLKPTHGTVLLEGKDIQKMKPGDIARKMSILPQSSTAPMDMTVYDLVCYGRMPHQGLFSSPNKIDEEKIEEALTQTNTSHMRYRRLDTLSGGERQRAWLAMAIAQNPEILLLDEPTNGLDPAGIHEIRELIVKLAKEEGLTVFISSHILSEIEQIADRVGIINHGCLVYEGEIREIKSNTWIEIGGDFSQNNIVQHLVDFGSVRVREASASEVKLDDMSNDRLADIITYITDLGFRIFRVTRESETLEDIFLELTKEV